jgi:SagB-type dehydrogenase family enzyme
MVLVGLLCICPFLAAQSPPSIALPEPQTQGGKPLMQALRDRRTIRDFSGERLSPQQLSNLLWAAFGINRPENGHRTAPSAMNAQEIDIYVATVEGLYLYHAPSNRLEAIQSGDLRPKTSGQDFAKAAPVTLIFVADFARMVKAKPEQKEFYSAIDTGYISQNVYLFCASEGLATVVHDLDRAPLAQAMNLRADQKIVLAQAVGMPKQI